MDTEKKNDKGRHFASCHTGMIIATILALQLLSGCEDNAESNTYNSAAPVSSLSANPSSITLYSGDDHAIFSAEGGTPPYSWSVSDTSLGSIPDTTASIITYNRNGTTVGANLIELSDSNGWSSEAIVTQTATVAP